MQRVRTKMMTVVFLLALLVVPWSTAQARWQALADYPGVFDLNVCRDGMRLQVISRGSGDGTISLYARSLAGDSDILVPQRDVELAQVEDFVIPSYTSSVEPANQNRFFSLKWSRRLPPGFVVELVFPQNDNEQVRYTVNDCELSKLTLDTFNRGNGGVGNGWQGKHKGYEIANKRLRASKGGGEIFWKTPTWQEASVILSKVDTTNKGEHGLLLMVQGEPASITNGAIRAVYDPNAEQVRIEAFVPSGPSGAKWYLLLAKPALFNDGDTLGAAVIEEPIENGNLTSTAMTIMVTQKSPSDNITRLLGVVDPNNVIDSESGQNVDLSFFRGKGGRIGLWFNNAARAEVDLFVQAINAP